MSLLEAVITDVNAHLTDASPATAYRVVQDALVAVRDLVGAEVAFVSRVNEDRRWFEFLDSDQGFSPFVVGDSHPLEETYCARVIDGRIGALIPDTSTVPEVRDLDTTASLPIGSHLAVPLYGRDGLAMGTLTCLSRHTAPGIGERDLELLTVFGAMIGRHLRFLLAHERRSSTVTALVDAVLAGGGPSIALQPIVDIATGRPAGFEALSRFTPFEDWTPDRWFREADGVGRGHELEAAAVRCALDLLPLLPDGATLSVNVSAGALCTSPEIAALLTGQDASRLVVELTEHARVDDYPSLCGNLDRVREAGARIAVDDAGSGYAGLDHILRLQPEVLKLDRTLVQDVARHPGRQAMCTAMVGFTERMDATLVAEGVEDSADLTMLGDLGVPLAQGFLLGHPHVPDGDLVGAGMGGPAPSL